jgi:hypothetical protein
MSDPDVTDNIDRDEPVVVRSERKGGFVRRRWKGLLLSLIVLLPAAILAVWTTITLGFSYSKGDRTGYNQKLSKKGWICKTWEGELAQSNVPGQAPQLFMYSVRSDSVAQAINAMSGERVTLSYEEHRGVPTKCFGETDYYVNGVRKAAGG